VKVTVNTGLKGKNAKVMTAKTSNNKRGTLSAGPVVLGNFENLIFYERTSIINAWQSETQIRFKTGRFCTINRKVTASKI
jgi:hypothetical protein